MRCADWGARRRRLRERWDAVRGTISRELMRNGGGGLYKACIAQKRTEQRRRSAYKWHKRIPALTGWVEDRLRDGWSPEQIAGRARASGYRLVSHEWIDRHVVRDQAVGGSLVNHLRHRRRRYRERYGLVDRRGRIVNRVGIEERPTG